MEETLGQGRSTEDAAADGTGRFTEDGHVRGVAAEVSDVTLYPLQGEDLVEDTVVTGMSLLVLLGQLGMSHEAEGTRTIFNADDDHATQGEVFPQVTTIPFGLEAAAVDPYHHRQTVAGRSGGCGNAEIETILIHHVGRTSGACGLRG